MKRPAARGFTLIELLVTIAIIAIGMSIAVPSMIGFQRNAELTTATNALTSAINVARGEAMKRSMHAYVVPYENGDWNTGYRVFVDMDRSGDYDASKDLTVTSQQASAGAIAANLEITGAGTAATGSAYLRFDGTGYVRNTAMGFAGAAFIVKRRDTKGTAQEYGRDAQTRHILIARTGRVRTCKPASASDANCNPADP